jgi:MYND finger
MRFRSTCDAKRALRIAFKGGHRSRAKVCLGDGVDRIFGVLSRIKEYMSRDENVLKEHSISQVEGFEDAALKCYPSRYHRAIRVLVAKYLGVPLPLPTNTETPKPDLVAVCAGCRKDMDASPLKRAFNESLDSQIPNRWICSRCHMVLYCGENCLMAHRQVHSALCVPFDCHNASAFS